MKLPLYSGSGQGVNLASESVAGEEDPGASLDMSVGSSFPGRDTRPVSEPPATPQRKSHECNQQRACAEGEQHDPANAAQQGS